MLYRDDYTALLEYNDVRDVAALAALEYVDWREEQRQINADLYERVQAGYDPFDVWVSPDGSMADDSKLDEVDEPEAAELTEDKPDGYTLPRRERNGRETTNWAVLMWAIQHGDKFTTPQARDAVGRSKNIVQAALKKLASDGTVKMVGTRKSTRGTPTKVWQAVQPPKGLELAA